MSYYYYPPNEFNPYLEDEMEATYGLLTLDQQQPLVFSSVPNYNQQQNSPARERSGHLLVSNPDASPYPYIPLENPYIFAPTAKELGNQKVFCAFCNLEFYRRNLKAHLNSTGHNELDNTSIEYLRNYERTEFEWNTFKIRFDKAIDRVYDLNTYVGMPDLFARIQIQFPY